MKIVNNYGSLTFRNGRIHIQPHAPIPIPVGFKLPDQNRINIPEPAIFEEGKADVTFRFVKEAQKSPPSDTFYPLVMKETRRLTLKHVNPSKKKVQETFLGVHLGIGSREDYEMQIKLHGAMAKFFNKKTFVSTERLSRNSALNPGKAITSSLNRFSDQVTMLRKVEAEDGSSDFYTGRVDTLAKAEEQASFLFLSELKLYLNPMTRHLAKGISQDPSTGQYRFVFAVQSLLSMNNLQKSDLKLFEKAVKTYEQLAAKGYFQVVDPNHPDVLLHVEVSPIPVAANPINFMNTIENILPDAFSGKLNARNASQKADRHLIEYVRSRANEFDPVTAKQIEDTIEHLQRARLLESDQLKSWQEIMYRAYLCELLKIPEVIHCKSSVDRTSVAGAISTAMKQWMRAGQTIPQINGRYDISAIVDLKIDEKGNLVALDQPGFEPFKELFAYSLHRALKDTELSRCEKGFKYYSVPQKKWGVFPSLLDLLPSRYLSENSSAARHLKIWSLRMFVAGVFAAIIHVLSSHGPLAIGIFFAALLFCFLVRHVPILRIGAAIPLIPLKAAIQADLVFAKKRINHEYMNVDDRSLFCLHSNHDA